MNFASFHVFLVFPHFSLVVYQVVPKFHVLYVFFPYVSLRSILVTSFSHVPFCTLISLLYTYYYCTYTYTYCCIVVLIVPHRIFFVASCCPRHSIWYCPLCCWRHSTIFTSFHSFLVVPYFPRTLTVYKYIHTTAVRTRVPYFFTPFHIFHAVPFFFFFFVVSARAGVCQALLTAGAAQEAAPGGEVETPVGRAIAVVVCRT